MFPHPCGMELHQNVSLGIDPVRVVPDEYVVVKGGVKPIPTLGTVFSCCCGPTIEAAACGVPHNQDRVSTVATIRRNGGSVTWCAERSQRGTVNNQHVNVIEFNETSFSEPILNPVTKAGRIDQGK